MGGGFGPVAAAPLLSTLLEHWMAIATAAGLTGVLVCLAVISGPVVAQQMFPAGGSGATSCPGGSSYKGSGYCRANKPGQQFFPAGGSGGTSCPSGSSYVGSGYCKTR